MLLQQVHQLQGKYVIYIDTNQMIQIEKKKKQRGWNTTHVI